MEWWTLVVVAFGLSADAFAVTIGKGLQLRRLDLRTTVMVSATFGAFHLVVPLLGWLAGSTFAEAVAGVDHWIAFGLLLLIGLKMIKEALSAHADEERVESIRWRELLLLGLATSIDALAVGVSFSLLDVDIVRAAVLIGVVAAGVSALGLALGRTVGRRFRAPAEVVGGLVLIAIGVKVLVDHLG